VKQNFLNCTNRMIRKSLKFDSKTQDIIACVLFLFLVPTLAHLLFSWIGFCPSDDGLNLALSRRLLEGQVPHRDFINLRPIGTPLLHLPFVLFGGDYTFWISRLFVWFEFACIAWTWTIIIVESFKISMSMIKKISIALIAFFFTTHIFPPMAWYTIDGLFFVSLGLSLCLAKSYRRRWLGYAAMGLACLCKQSFMPMIPLSLIIFGDWRKLSLWLAAAIPWLIYLSYLGLFGAIPEAMFQLTARTNQFYPRGITAYLQNEYFPWGIILGYFSMILSFSSVRTENSAINATRKNQLGIFIVFGVLSGFSIVLMRNRHASSIHSFAIFGIALGSLIYLILHQRKEKNLIHIGI
jgi:hypothetical protein